MPKNLNLYGYSHNSPVVFVDPNGLEVVRLPNEMIRDILTNNNADLSVGAPTARTGLTFEGAVLRSLKRAGNTELIASLERTSRTENSRRTVNNIQPDHVGPTTTYKWFAGIARYRQTGLLFMDAKTTNGRRSLTPSSDSHQLRGFINVLGISFRRRRNVGVGASHDPRDANQSIHN